MGWQPVVFVLFRCLNKLNLPLDLLFRHLLFADDCLVLDLLTEFLFILI